MVQAVSGYSAGYYEKEEDHTLRNILLTTAVAALVCYGVGKYNLNKNTSIFDGVEAEKMKKIGLLDNAAGVAEKLGKTADDVKDLNFCGRFANMVDSWLDWGNYAKKAQAPKTEVTPAPSLKVQSNEAKDLFNENYKRVQANVKKFDDEVKTLTKRQNELNAFNNPQSGQTLTEAQKKELDEIKEKLNSPTFLNARQSAEIELEQIELVKQRAELSKLKAQMDATDKSSAAYTKAQSEFGKAKTSYEKRLSKYRTMKSKIKGDDAQSYSAARHKNIAIMEEQIARKLDKGEALTADEIMWINFNQSKKSLFEGMFYNQDTQKWGTAHAQVTLRKGSKKGSSKSIAFSYTEEGDGKWARPTDKTSFGDLIHSGDAVPTGTGSHNIQEAVNNFNTRYGASGYNLNVNNGRILANGGNYATNQEITWDQLKALENAVKRNSKNITLPAYSNPFFVTVDKIKTV